MSFGLTPHPDVAAPIRPLPAPSLEHARTTTAAPHPVGARPVDIAPPPVITRPSRPVTDLAPPHALTPPRTPAVAAPAADVTPASSPAPAIAPRDIAMRARPGHTTVRAPLAPGAPAGDPMGGGGRHHGGGHHHHHHGGGGHWRGRGYGAYHGWRDVPRVQRIEIAVAAPPAAPPAAFPWGWIVAALFGGGVLVLAGKSL